MKKQSQLLDTIPNLFLFFLFTACMLAVLLCGARIYQNVSTVMEQQYSVATCTNYLTAKVRHYDRTGGVEKGKLGDVDTLVLRDTYDGEEFITHLYSYDGYLMELFSFAEGDFLPSDGMQIIPLDELKISEEDGMLRLYCREQEMESEAVLWLHNEGAGV